MMKVMVFFALLLSGQFVMSQQKDSTTIIQQEATGQFPYYFPLKSAQKNASYNAKALDSFHNKWYSKMLASMQESSLATEEGCLEVYRFTWLRTFEAPVMVRVQYSGISSWSVTTTTLDGRGGYEPGDIAGSETFRITEKKWKSIARKIRRSDFWNQPAQQESTAGFDGEEWVLEGRYNGKYHVMTRWSPDEKSAFAKCCLSLLELARVKIYRMSDAQREKLEDLEDRAEDYYDDSSLNKAISLYWKVVRRTAVSSTTHWNAMLKIAEIYTKTGKHAAAYEQYNQMKQLYLEGSKQRFLCRKLADTEIDLKNYDRALTLLKDYYNYELTGSYCGNALAEDRQEVGRLFFRAYLGQKDTSSAINVILPYMFYNGLVENHALVDQVLPVFLKKYDRSFLKNELDKAAASIIKIEKPKQPVIYQTTFLGTLIRIPEFYQSIKDTTYISRPRSELGRRQFTIIKGYFYSRLCLP